MRRLSCAAVFALLVACPLHVVHAQQGECAAIAASAASAASARPIDRLSLLSRTDCLGGTRDLDALTKAAMKVLPARLSDTASNTEIRLVVLSVLDPVLKATSRERDIARDTRGEASPERAMLLALDSSVTLVRSAVEAGLRATDDKVLLTGTWAWDPNTAAFGDLPLRVASMVNDACAPVTAEACTGSVRTAEFVLRASKLVERSLAYYGRPFLAAALAGTTRRDAQWTAYFGQTLVQFPWELALNSARFTRAARAKSGFAMPPSDQWVLLHPMVGVEYVWSASKGSRMTPAVAMEILGYNRWSWNAANKPAGALGASVVAAFSDRANADNVGYGLLVRYAHRYSLTVTSRGGKSGVLLSSELGTWLSGKQDQAQDAMRLKLP
ncbi:MAG TPA: hypothetical protein VIK25_01665 [Gemmatimonadaceae bacterium]